MHRRILFCLMIGLTSALHGSADSAPKSQSHRFTDELCTYEIQFQTEKIAEEQVKGTVELLFNNTVAHVDEAFASPENMTEAERLDTGKLDAECAARTAGVEGLRTVPLDGLDAFKRSLVDVVKDRCTLARVERLSFSSPSKLREHPSTAKCAIYVDALEGKADINAVFNKLAATQCQSNADRQWCLREAKETASDPAAQRLYILAFGWHNCVNGFVRQVDEAARQKLVARFLKAYNVKRLRCDQP